jgi:hypothetical protein
MEISPFVIGDRPGFQPRIGILVGMLDYARRTTFMAVQGLDVRQLDHLQDGRSNSIGMLLAHIAAVEVAYQLATFDKRDLTADEQARWGAALDLGQPAREAIRGQPLAHYVSSLEAVRARTLSELLALPDSWLDEQTPFWNGLPANNFFKWFHVLEDEVNHRGQIRWLRQRL